MTSHDLPPVEERDGGRSYQIKRLGISYSLKTDLTLPIVMLIIAINTMKSLPPNFWLPKRMVSAGFLIAVASLSVTTPTAYAGEPLGPPGWLPIEMKAIDLYLAGTRQEVSDPQAAAKTLQQAREDSTAALIDGGGANQYVMHNDQMIAQALAIAQEDAAKAANTSQVPSSTPAPVIAQPDAASAQQNMAFAMKQKGSGNNLPAKSGGYHVQTTVKAR